MDGVLDGVLEGGGDPTHGRDRRGLQVGINVNGLDAWRHFELMRERAADRPHFVELLLDNYLHLSPAVVAQTLRGVPVGIHIMWSGWASQPAEDLERLAALVRSWYAEVEVLYVSDHLLRTHDPHGRRLPQTRELDYLSPDLVDRLARWQELLDRRLLVENFSSESSYGSGQASWARDASRATGAGILFDVSNAVVAEVNGADPWSAWLPLLEEGLVGACHASGYRAAPADPSMLVDSHDGPLTELTWSRLEELSQRGVLPSTLVIEREGVLDHETWFADVDRASRCLRRPALVSP